MTLALCLLSCATPVCGSLDKPHSTPECPCVDYAVWVPSAGWGSASCRRDQTSKLATVAEDAVLLCTCEETP